MININELKQLVEFIANKHQTGASMSPAEFNIAVQSSLDDVIMYYYGLPQKYVPGNPMPAVAWEINQLVSDYLSALKVTTPLTVGNDGTATIPPDYYHVSSICCHYAIANTTTDDNQEQQGSACDTEGSTTYANNNSVQPEMMDVPVVIVDDAKWCRLMVSHIRKPSKRYPICKYENGNLLFAPKDIADVELTYLRLPIKPVWGYTTPNGFDPQYDATASTNIELPSILKNQMAYSVLTKLGISIRETQLQQFAEQMKAQGL